MAGVPQQSQAEENALNFGSCSCLAISSYEQESTPWYDISMVLFSVSDSWLAFDVDGPQKGHRKAKICEAMRRANRVLRLESHRQGKPTLVVVQDWTPPELVQIK